MTITINLSPEQERRLAERAARAGQDVTGYVHHLIDRDIDAESLDAILAPVRRDFERSGMTDDDLAALVEEVREDHLAGEAWSAEQGIMTSAAVFDCHVQHGPCLRSNDGFRRRFPFLTILAPPAMLRRFPQDPAETTPE